MISADFDAVPTRSGEMDALRLATTYPRRRGSIKAAAINGGWSAPYVADHKDVSRDRVFRHYGRCPAVAVLSSGTPIRIQGFGISSCVQ